MNDADESTGYFDGLKRGDTAKPEDEEFREENRRAGEGASGVQMMDVPLGSTSAPITVIQQST